MWKYQYDEYYFEMEREFSKYKALDLDFETEEVVSRHFKNGR